MGLMPPIKKKPVLLVTQKCLQCGTIKQASDFLPTRSLFFPSGVITICNSCLNKIIDDNNGDWAVINKICQYADIPFIPEQWDKINSINTDNSIVKYAEIFLQSQYDDLGWTEYYNAFKELKEADALEQELPIFKEQKKKELQRKWGANYDEEALQYLEDLFDGLFKSQNVNGALQIDQALKVCKLSYEIDCRIREGTEFDKILTAYDKLVKCADFTPKNIKNVNAFDSIGEVYKWLEKRGWVNQYYDNVKKDIVDESMENIQAFARRLYTNESDIGEEITHRLQLLHDNKDEEHSASDNYYLSNTNYDLDNYEKEDYEQLMNNQEFDPSLGD